MSWPRRSSASSVLLALTITFGACAPKPRAALVEAPHPAAADAGAAQEEEEADAEDVDGEVEAVSEPVPEPSPCPKNMVLVEADDARFCIDKYEASLVETDSEGNEKPYPHWLPVDGHVVRAVSEPDVFPQGFISEVQAEDACAASGKRLCSHAEWKTACMGPAKTTFPYGDARQPGTCHDTGKSAVGAVFGTRALTDPGLVAHPAKPAPASATAAKTASGGKPAKPSGKTAKARPVSPSTKGRAAETTRARATRPGSKPSSGSRTAQATKAASTITKSTSKRRGPAKASARPASVEPSVWTQLNDPRLGQVDGALAKTGSHQACVNGYGAVDMVGNLHEWVKTDPALPHGTFAGGYYLDTALNGDGCQYRTTAHAHDYHDYSTGFRCCADPTP